MLRIRDKMLMFHEFKKILPFEQISIRSVPKNEQTPIDKELNFKVIDYAYNFKIDLCSTYFLKSCLVCVLSLNLVYIS